MSFKLGERKRQTRWYGNLSPFSPVTFTMRNLLEANRRDVALVIGNGINRFQARHGENSWEDLLTRLSAQHLALEGGIPAGMSPTEFYDVIDLAAGQQSGKLSLQKRFCDLMETWLPLPQHERITAWASQNSSPILTTNFENTLGTICSAKLTRCGDDGFTAYYPWSSCFSTHEVCDPLTDFAIWHINGQQKYRQSIRLGLSHYMGSVERARAWLQKSGARLFGATDIRHWRGANTWLQVFLHKPLIVFGLKLEQEEVFLRWLLIQRAKYFRKHPDRRKPAWFVYVEGGAGFGAGKALFLRSTGVEPYPVNSYDDIYAATTWAAE